MMLKISQHQKSAAYHDTITNHHDITCYCCNSLYDYMGGYVSLRVKKTSSTLAAINQKAFV